MADEVKLIDRDEVGAKIQAMYIRREINYGGENEFCRGMRKALRIIENAPTIEAEPVKHGKWIEKNVSRMKWIPYDDDDVNPDDVDIECMTEQKCSYCKRWTIKFTYHIELDYCPNCGSKQDL